jgi:hypothetical protein
MKPQFLVTTPELDAQLARLQKAIRLSMNGVVADSMRDHGLHYKKNYGVTTLRLKEIAREVKPNLALAQRLWLLGIRETMLLATLLAPQDTFPENIAESWSRDSNNQELIEQLTMNLFQHLPYAVPLAIRCLNDTSPQVQSIGFSLGLRVSTKLTESEINHYIERGISLAGNNDNYLIKTIAACLARFCRLGRDVARKVRYSIPQPVENESYGLLTIRQFVESELIFLGYEQDNK